MNERGEEEREMFSSLPFIAERDTQMCFPAIEIGPVRDTLGTPELLSWERRPGVLFHCGQAPM